MGKKTWADHYLKVRQGFSKYEDQAGLMTRIIDTLATGGEFSVRVTDHTLMPFIQPGDLMIFVSTNYEKMKVGDFVLYRLANGVPAVRRVVKKTLLEGHATIITRSDINVEDNDRVRAAQVLGRLAFLERHGKRIKGSKLNRGIVDWFTDFGTRHPLAKVGEMFLMLLPASARPGYVAPKPDDDDEDAINAPHIVVPANGKPEQVGDNKKRS